MPFNRTVLLLACITLLLGGTVAALPYLRNREKENTVGTTSPTATPTAVATSPSPLSSSAPTAIRQTVDTIVTEETAESVTAPEEQDATLTQSDSTVSKTLEDSLTISTSDL